MRCMEVQKVVEVITLVKLAEKNNEQKHPLTLVKQMLIAFLRGILPR